MPVRTSATDPLRIATLDVPSGGAIGVTFAPGKHQVAPMYGDTWERSLDADLAAIKAWGASTLVTLLEPHEFAELRIPALASRTEELGLAWHGLPITDGAAPDARFLGPWRSRGPQLARELQVGQRIVVHCKGGLGRAGTVACMLLESVGGAASADAAMAMVRAVRPGAIETAVQEAFLRTWYGRRHAVSGST